MSFDKKTILKATDLNWSTDFNYSYDYNYSGGDVCGPESSMHFDSIFIPVLYTVALIVGLLGNGLVLVVLWRKRRSWNVTDIFILHLSLADVLLLLTLPLWAVEAVRGWSFGTGLCKLTGALFRINFYCGIFMLACISFDRYLSIVHAVQMYSRKKPMVIHCCCLTVWLFCLLLSIPDWIFLKDTMNSRLDDKTECLIPNPQMRLATHVFYHVVGFALPAAMLLFCYTRILLRLKRGSQCVQKKRAMHVIVALVLAFFISWTPYNITLMVDTVHNLNDNISNQTSCAGRTALDVALTATSTLAYLHCCVNPVLYAFVGVKFRQQVLDMLRPLGISIKRPAGLMSRRSSAWSESVDTSHTSAF
ncbi:C-X-C chemokine receptor type 3-like [Triplophysa dalaica]|uniref:C-X-C chemokine receptor type 3-like n=1 Tax=Triplophysa dalaica TaxID=1582913 RepID=UPI0024DFF999|nr:C-X-C chemokine receptor type 3-like [Triplophysa dalaica]